ncbi:MFS transporter [Staphylococcus muscae]|uniref:Bcr/CflA family efflux transporter n=1 Tax=Staphylococcus muscae TaxID=1294 RepID=A0A240CAW1_9STAP|nr:Bcr/CflA family efflux MFS transporter [Staphylococcus muscae]AVQ33824.1 MFS transporter [Staphylococcus muscae]PNZ06177.1 MFS transporter [Staphylococcus muscae]GGA94832.1 Bcr/CflA family drug resistance efflux transporter [Staphylococcus muscae]SNW04373.1 bicyclomycin resistance protein TcaB [Staphylococcus muscae]
MTKTKIDLSHLSFIILLGAMTAFGPMLSDMYSPALPLVQKDLGTSTSQVQLTLSIAMIGIAFGQFIFGVIADRVPRKTLVLTILSLVVIASLASAISSSVSLFIVARLVQGLAGGGAIVIARATVAELYHGEILSRFFTALMVVNGIISILAPLVSALILTVAEWRAIFVALAVIGAVMFLVVLTHPKMKTLNTTHETHDNFGAIFKDFGRLLKTPHFLVPMFLQGVTYIMIFSYGAGAPFITQNVYGLSPQNFSMLMVLTGIGLIISSQLANILLRFYNQLNVLAGFIIVQVIGAVLVMVVLLLHLPLAVLIIGFMLCVAPVTAIGPLAYSLAMQARTGGSGSASSLLGLFQFVLGSSVAPLIGIQGPDSVIPYSVVLGTTIVLLLALMFLTRILLKTTLNKA